jgi:uncharacterized protein
MQLDLTRYRQPVNHFARTFPAAEVGDDPGTYHVAAPVELAFDVIKDKDRFRLAGTVATELELVCSRCLEPFRLPVSQAFDLRYLPAGAADAAGEREVAEEDLGVSYYRDDQVDLNELIKEQFYLALPMKPLCQESCKGLCARCGTNLNLETCACAPAWEDPRFAALKSLRRDA